jgi:UDP-N-acetylglucosamine pyrophosphorylase
MDCQIIILAAGNGSRMRSDLPKVMHQVGGKSMIERVLSNSREVTDDIILVHSPQLLKYLHPYQNICKFALQSSPHGTADAVHSALNQIDDNKVTLVIFGDNPFISPEIINKLLDHLNKTNSSVVTLSFKRDDPGQYGRIVTDELGNFLRIVEFKKANNQEKEIKLCNSGIMVFGRGILKKYLPHCLVKDEKDDSELYLTNMVGVCANHNEKVSYMLSSEHDAVIGVNTKEELLEANSIYLNEFKNMLKE